MGPKEERIGSELLKVIQKAAKHYCENEAKTFEDKVRIGRPSSMPMTMRFGAWTMNSSTTYALSLGC